jgi:phosphoribosyl 1,2-cyclic phosphodiesterase
VRFASLGSGSKGNSTLIETEYGCLMIDCGFSTKETIKRLDRLGKSPQDILAILVTHEHSDHWKGVLPFASKFSIDIYATAGCYRAVNVIPSLSKRYRVICSHNSFMINNVNVLPIPVPHDASEPVQYIISCDQNRLGILTDVGNITPYIIKQYNECTGLLVEANHDVALLEAGDYPKFLKDRVAGHWGHLNNHQTASLLNSINQDSIKKLVIGHISENNNNSVRVKEAIEGVFLCPEKIIYANQNEGFDWVYLSSL